jgi:hypothetical protein
MQKDKMRKWPAMLAAALMLAGAFVIVMPSSAQAYGPFILNNTPIGNYRVDLDIKAQLTPENVGSLPIVVENNTASIIQYTGPGGNVVIPTVFQYPMMSDSGEIVPYPPVQNVLAVTSIAGGAFQGRDDIITLTIPEGVDYIGAGAFSGCTHLTTLVFLGTSLPSNVSEDWLLGANQNLSGTAKHVSGIGLIGVDFHGLQIMNRPMVTPFVPPVQLSGTVVDLSGTAVAGALVVVNNTNATTDADGHFLLMAPPGLQSMTISGSGVQTTTVSTYLWAGGAEMGEVPVKLAQTSSEPHTSEAVALLIGVFVISLVLIAIGMVLMKKRAEE